MKLLSAFFLHCLFVYRCWRNKTIATDKQRLLLQSEVRVLFFWMLVTKWKWQCMCCNEGCIIRFVWFLVVLLDIMSLQQNVLAGVLHLKWLLCDGFGDQCSFHRCHVVTAVQSSLNTVRGKHKNHRPSSVHMTFSFKTVTQEKQCLYLTWKISTDTNDPSAVFPFQNIHDIFTLDLFLAG